MSFPVTPIDAMFDRDDEQKKNLIATTQDGPRKILSVSRIDGVAQAVAA